MGTVKGMRNVRLDPGWPLAVSRMTRVSGGSGVVVPPAAGTTPSVTSKGPRAVSDSTKYNHYSLLQTFQRVFGLGCLQFTCDTKHVTPMTPLFESYHDVVVFQQHPHWVALGLLLLASTVGLILSFFAFVRLERLFNKVL